MEDHVLVRGPAVLLHLDPQVDGHQFLRPMSPEVPFLKAPLLPRVPEIVGFPCGPPVKAEMVGDPGSRLAQAVHGPGTVDLELAGGKRCPLGHLVVVPDKVGIQVGVIIGAEVMGEEHAPVMEKGHGMDLPEGDDVIPHLIGGQIDGEGYGPEHGQCPGVRVLDIVEPVQADGISDLGLPPEVRGDETCPREGVPLGEDRPRDHHLPCPVVEGGVEVIVHPCPGIGLPAVMETVQLVPGVGEPSGGDDVMVRGLGDGALTEVIDGLGGGDELVPRFPPVRAPCRVFPAEIGDPPVMGGGQIMFATVPPLGPAEDAPARGMVPARPHVHGGEFPDLLEGVVHDRVFRNEDVRVVILLPQRVKGHTGQYDHDDDDIDDQVFHVHGHHVRISDARLSYIVYILYGNPDYLDNLKCSSRCSGKVLQSMLREGAEG